MESVKERFQNFTDREHQVLALIVAGKQNKVIAFDLGIAEGTVKKHTAAMLRKAGLSNRTALTTVVASLKNKIEVVVTQQGDVYRAHVEGKPELSGRGRSPYEAVGDLFVNQIAATGVNIELVSESDMV